MNSCALSTKSSVTLSSVPPLGMMLKPRVCSGKLWGVIIFSAF